MLVDEVRFLYRHLGKAIKLRNGNGNIHYLLHNVAPEAIFSRTLSFRF